MEINKQKKVKHINPNHSHKNNQEQTTHNAPLTCIVKKKQGMWPDDCI